MSERLFEATVLPSRAVSWEGRLYASGEIALLPLEEANALEAAGVVVVAADPVSTPRTSRSRKPSTR